MKPFEKCPVCGGKLENKHVEKLLRGSGNTMSMHFKALGQSFTVQQNWPNKAIQPTI